MPRLDGLSTLREIMARFPRPVIMVSSLTREGARETIQALTWGAVDFIAKPESKANVDTIVEDLATRLRRAARARVYPLPAARRPELLPLAGPVKVTRPRRGSERVVVIGASTGGPRALHAVVSQLSPDLPAAMLIVQHMPVGFTRSLAERLDVVSPLAIKEAEPGDVPEVGRGLVAPGGYHMLLNSSGKVELNQNPPVHGVRPAVDVTMASVSKIFGAMAIGVVLTGMGSDGTNGAVLIHSAGGRIIAEAEETCVVWGMPRSVAEAGVADEIVPLHEVAAAIEKAVKL
jgi:two-component system chemotaxis response regulator CheB